MNSKADVCFLMIWLVALAGCGGSVEQAETTAAAVEEPAPEVVQTPDGHVAELEAMCAEAGDAMVARQAEANLYGRVGGRDGIHTVVADTVARHLVNDQILHLMEGVDTDHLINQVTDFLVVATGGEGEYAGRDMVEAHAHLGLSNVEFLAAGSDLGAAMDAAGWGEGEKQELLCAFVSLRGDVVTR